MRILGSCHCRNIAFTLEWTPDPTEIPARACTCSFCVKHGGVWTSCPTGALDVSVRDPSLVSIYNFGTGTADFHICKSCGAVPLVTSRVEGRLYAVVSVNALDNVPKELLRPVSATFDEETAASRLARRARNWTPRVSITEDA